MRTIKDSTSKNQVEKLIELLKTALDYRYKITHIQEMPERPAAYGELTVSLPESIKKYLSGIKLYTHQCQVINSARSGHNTIITTSTSSGKTLSFNIPVVSALAEDEKATALYIYPNKALSNDQLKSLLDIEQKTKVKINPAIYDGDTPKQNRPSIKANSRVIITNPFELHYILPWHQQWSRFFANLKYIIIDEAHFYRGVFGSNIAYLLRRLRRVCNAYGSNPKFILASATIANPLEFAEKMTGLKFNLVDQDGSPKTAKYFILYNPFTELGGQSTNWETRHLFSLFLRHNLQTLCFLPSRRLAELIAAQAREDNPQIASRITAYRSGYLAEERREIENLLKSSQILGVTSTNALEVGIDIGSLDAVIISGYPGTIASTWQQAGRAGRGGSDAVITLIANDNPIDQYYIHHPQLFFDRPSEHAIIDLNNPYIASGHLLCAAAELPITDKDREIFGDRLDKYLKPFTDKGVLIRTESGWSYAGQRQAAQIVKLNGATSDTVRIVSDGKLLETMSREQALREAYQGAIILHRGQTYQVKNLDLDSGTAIAFKVNVDHHTEVAKNTDVRILCIESTRKHGNFEISYGAVRVTEHYSGYKVIKEGEVKARYNLDQPPHSYATMGFWFTIPASVKNSVLHKGRNFAGGLHGIEHAMISLIPVNVMCDRWDLGALSHPNHPDTGLATVIVYDGFEGGIGLAEKASQLFTKIVLDTYNQVSQCPCKTGCPSCVLSPRCGSNNDPMDKKAAVAILRGLLEAMNNIKLKEALKEK